MQQYDQIASETSEVADILCTIDGSNSSLYCDGVIIKGDWLDNDQPCFTCRNGHVQFSRKGKKVTHLKGGWFGRDYSCSINNTFQFHVQIAGSVEKNLIELCMYKPKSYSIRYGLNVLTRMFINGSIYIHYYSKIVKFFILECYKKNVRSLAYHKHIVEFLLDAEERCIGTPIIYACIYAEEYTSDHLSANDEYRSGLATLLNYKYLKSKKHTQLVNKVFRYMTGFDMTDKIRDILRYLFSWEWRDDYEINVQDLLNTLSIASFSKDVGNTGSIDEILTCIADLGYKVL